jgi:hypothetical protein
MDQYDPERYKLDIIRPKRLPRACIYVTKLILSLVVLLALLCLGPAVVMASVVFLVPDSGPRPIWASIFVLAMWVVYLTAIVRTGLKTVEFVWKLARLAYGYDIPESVTGTR